MGYQSFVAIGNLTFNPDEFLQEATKVLSGRDASVVPIGTDKAVTMEQGDKEKSKYSFFINHPDSGERIQFEDPLFKLLDESVSEREEFLRNNRHWFEVVDDIFDREVSRISTIENPAMRIDEARRWKESSVQVFYDDLRKHLLQRQEFTFDRLIPPNSEGLLWVFRLGSKFDEESEFQKILNTAAEDLKDDEGLVRAILQFSYLPTPLPSCLIDTALGLSTLDKRLLIKLLIQEVDTSLTKFHLLHILTLFGNEEPTYHRLARRILNSLITDAEKISFDAFRAILNWTSNEFDHWPEIELWPTQIKLSMAWAHAAALYRIFNSSGVPDRWLEKTFNQSSGRFASHIFDRDPQYWLDISMPRRVDYETFFVAGLIYCLGESTCNSMNEQAKFILSNLCFQDINGELFPRLPLLRDPSRNLNCLQSFLAADLGKSLVTQFDITKGDLITQESLHNHARASLNQLSTVEDDISAWLQLYTIVGDIPIYEDMHIKFRALLGETDYLKLAEKDAKMGLIPMILASHHSINFKDEELTHHLRDHLVRISQHLSKREIVSNQSRVDTNLDMDSEIVYTGHLVLESAVNISLSTNSVQAAISYFGEILQDIVSVWPSIKEECRFILQRIYEDLPVEQSMELLPLLVSLRVE